MRCSKDTNKIIFALNEFFYSLYTAGENISNDVGICKFHGRYTFKTYMQAAPL